MMVASSTAGEAGAAPDDQDASTGPEIDTPDGNDNRVVGKRTIDHGSDSEAGNVPTALSAVPPTSSSPKPAGPQIISRLSQLGLLPDTYRCSHPAMVRMYTSQHTCIICGRHPHAGFLYRCIQDRQLTLAENVRRNESSAFDGLGSELAGLVKPFKRGPELRMGADKGIVTGTGEMSQLEMASYTAAQIDLLVAQRVEVLRAAAEQRSSSPIAWPEAVSGSACHGSQWIPLSREECLFSVCSSCRPSFADRAFLSLNGIANGEVPACAALGAGFDPARGRPVADARMVRNLGLWHKTRMFSDWQ